MTAFRGPQLIEKLPLDVRIKKLLSDEININSQKEINSKYIVLFTSSLLLVVSLFSIDLYNPSLPSMTKDLNVTQALTRGLVVAYLFGLAISPLIYGPLSDFFGRRKVIIVSLILTIIANLLSASATTGHQLLLYRLLTGLGAGGCSVISRTVLRDFFHDKKELTKAFSVFAMTAQISPSFAPIIGGFIEEYYSWQINFIALAIITFLSLILLFFIFKETHSNTRSFSIKTMLGDYKKLVLDKNFISYSIMSALVFAYTLGYFTVNPFVFQNEYGFSPSENGMIYILYSAGIFLGAYLMRKLANRYDPEIILQYSIIALIITPCIMLVATISHSAYILLVFSTTIAILCGFAAPTLISLSILPFSKIAGSASALQVTIKMIGTALTLFFLLLFHVDTGEGLSMIFSIISLLLIPFFYFTMRPRKC